MKVSRAVSFLMLIRLRAAMQVPCEQIKNKKYFDRIFLMTDSSINSCIITNTNIHKAETFLEPPPASVDVFEIKILFMHHNRKMKHLPMNVHKIFPELTDYYASKCSVTKISYQHFRGLPRLEVLLLDQNKIERITKDTFQDLTSLHLLKLNGNRIKAIESRTFVKLFSLRKLYLRNNICIDQDFKRRAIIIDLPEDHAPKCLIV